MTVSSTVEVWQKTRDRREKAAKENKIVELAPIYDCGSSFYPQLDEKAMYAFVRDRRALEERVMTFPTASLCIDGSKVKYHEFLLSDKGAAARAAVATIIDTVDFTEIDELIENIPTISAVWKEFLRALIAVRREVILLPVYQLYKKEHGQAVHYDPSAKEALQDARNKIQASTQQQPGGAAKTRRLAR